MSQKWILRSIVSALLCAGGLSPAQAADERQSLEELRNTVINLLDALVKRGIVSQEQASAMVADAQAKATAEAEARAAKDSAEAGAVRVTYVPETVRAQIRDEVREELRKDVAKDVVAQAREEKWGVPGALPSWVSAVRLSGDLRVRTQNDMYSADNLQGAYLDFLAVNSRGGIGRAGDAALLNVSKDRLRERIRLRLGLEAALTNGVTMGVRLASGNTTDPVSTNQTLGQYGGRYNVVIDQAYLRFDTKPADVSRLTVLAGRTPNPFYSTDLVWDQDMTFEGVATTLRQGFGEGRHVYVTAGAFPLQEIELSSSDKWLFGGQLGLDWSWGDGGRLRAAASYYHFENTVGRRNALDSTLLDYTAPRFLQRGNTLFDIRNDADASTNLFALAADYRIAGVTVGVDWPVLGHKLFATADYVKNLGYDTGDVLARTGLTIRKRNTGYQAELGVGTMTAARAGDWRASVSYRYVQRDAVMDAFTDSDFHLGGTDAKGFVLRGEWWFRDRTWLSLRYLSANEIDGPPLGIDTVMLDVNSQF